MLSLHSSDMAANRERDVAQFPRTLPPRTIPLHILCIHTYTCMHTHIYIHTRIHIHTYIHTYIYTYTYIHIHAYIYVHTYTDIHIQTYIHIHRYVCEYTMYVCMCTYMYKYAKICQYI